MKKTIIIALVVALALGASYVIGTGFIQNSSVVLEDYTVSEDGNEIILNVSLASSMGYIRDCEDKGGGVKPHYLHFYSTFGGLNSSLGAKNEFVLELDENDTEIFFYRGKGGYDLVLEKNRQTGIWEAVK